MLDTENRIRWVSLSANGQRSGIGEETIMPSLVTTDRITHKHWFTVLKDGFLIMSFSLHKPSDSYKALYNLYLLYETCFSPVCKCNFTLFLNILPVALVNL